MFIDHLRLGSPLWHIGFFKSYNNMACAKNQKLEGRVELVRGGKAAIRFRK
jgi:hypothetical protein